MGQNRLTYQCPSAVTELKHKGHTPRFWLLCKLLKKVVVMGLEDDELSDKIFLRIQGDMEWAHSGCCVSKW